MSGIGVHTLSSSDLNRSTDGKSEEINEDSHNSSDNEEVKPSEHELHQERDSDDEDGSKKVKEPKPPKKLSTQELREKLRQQRLVKDSQIVRSLYETKKLQTMNRKPGDAPKSSLGAYPKNVDKQTLDDLFKKLGTEGPIVAAPESIPVRTNAPNSFQQFPATSSAFTPSPNPVRPSSTSPTPQSPTSGLSPRGVNPQHQASNPFNSIAVSNSQKFVSNFNNHLHFEKDPRMLPPPFSPLPPPISTPFDAPSSTDTITPSSSETFATPFSTPEVTPFSTPSSSPYPTVHATSAVLPSTSTPSSSASSPRPATQTPVAPRPYIPAFLTEGLDDEPPAPAVSHQSASSPRIPSPVPSPRESVTPSQQYSPRPFDQSSAAEVSYFGVNPSFSHSDMTQSSESSSSSSSQPGVSNTAVAATFVTSSSSSSSQMKISKPMGAQFRAQKASSEGSRAPPGVLGATPAVAAAISATPTPAPRGIGAAKRDLIKQEVQPFNVHPKLGLRYLIEHGLIEESPQSIAHLLRTCEYLDKQKIGEYLGEPDALTLEVLNAFVESFDFTDMDMDVAVRRLLHSFRLPGEAQKIDRIMNAFAQQYYKCNPDLFKSSDVVYILSFALIMLNTDIHSPNIKKKMSKQQFIKNNKGINEGEDLPETFLEDIYLRILYDEFRMDDPFVNAIKKGWLHVKSTASSATKLHWFVLTDDKKLHDVRRIGESKGVNLIKVEEMSVVNIKPKKFGFDLEPIPAVKRKAPTYSFVAPNEREFKIWLRILQKISWKRGIESTS